MRHRRKKLAAAALALAAALAMCVTAYAAEPGQILTGDGLPPSGNASYVVTQPEPSTSVDVTFLMEAPNEYYSEEGAFYYQTDVTLTSESARVFTISDLLVQVARENPAFSFTTRVGNEVSPFAADSSYLCGVIHDGISFQPDTSYFDLWGWEFRVNELFPVVYDNSLEGYVGTATNETYLSDGDVVHFFLDYPVTLYDFDYSTSFIRLDASVAGNAVTVQVQGQRNHLEGSLDNPQNLVMQVGAYTAFATPTVVKMYDASGAEVASESSGAGGRITFEGLAAGTYTLRSDSALLPMEADEDWGDCLFTQTSGYAVVTVP